MEKFKSLENCYIPLDLHKELLKYINGFVKSVLDSNRSITYSHELGLYYTASNLPFIAVKVLFKLNNIPSLVTYSYYLNGKLSGLRVSTEFIDTKLAEYLRTHTHSEYLEYYEKGLKLFKYSM